MVGHMRPAGRRVYPSLERAEAGRLDIGRLIGQPEPRGHVHDEAEGVSILDLSHAHALHISLGTALQLVLGETSQQRGSENSTHSHTCTHTYVHVCTHTHTPPLQLEISREEQDVLTCGEVRQ